MTYMFIVSACGSIGSKTDGRRQITYFAFHIFCDKNASVAIRAPFKQKRTCSVVVGVFLCPKARN